MVLIIACIIIMIQLVHGGNSMTTIIPIRDLRKTSEISELAHAAQEPVFVTKNGYSDLVVMSVELYDQLVSVHRIDQAISAAEKEVKSGAEPLDAEQVLNYLDHRFHG